MALTPNAQTYLDEVSARLADADDWGITRWHELGCAYHAGHACDCMRLDVEWLLDIVTALTNRDPNAARCPSIHHENDGARRWRCDQLAGHPGADPNLHTSQSGHRRWTD